MKKLLLITSLFLIVPFAYAQLAWSKCASYFSPVEPISLTIGPGGAIYGIWAHPQFVAGILKSTDNGQTWIDMIPTDFPNTTPAYDIAYSGNKLIAISNGLYASTDGGTTWTPTGGTDIPSTDDMVAMTVMPNGDIYLAASHNIGPQTTPHLYKSTNNGASWTAITMSGIASTMEVPVDIINNNGYLVMSLKNMSTMAGAVYYSSNGGVNWTAASSPPLASNNFYSANSFARNNSGDIYMVGTELSPSGIKFFKSSNNGQTWSSVSYSGLGLVYAGPFLWNGTTFLLGGGTSTAVDYAMYFAAITTGLSENERLDSTVFPNPGNGLFNVKSELKQVSVSDISGRIVFETENSLQTLDLRNLPEGVYLLKGTTNENKIEFKRVVIQK